MFNILSYFIVKNTYKKSRGRKNNQNKDLNASEYH